MITMRKFNVVKVVSTEEEAAKLERSGFTRTGSAKVPTKGTQPPFNGDKAVTGVKTAETPKKDGKTTETPKKDGEDDGQRTDQ